MLGVKTIGAAYGQYALENGLTYRDNRTFSHYRIGVDVKGIISVEWKSKTIPAPSDRDLELAYARHIKSNEKRERELGGFDYRGIRISTQKDDHQKFSLILNGFNAGAITTNIKLKLTNGNEIDLTLENIEGFASAWFDFQISLDEIEAIGT